MASTDFSVECRSKLNEQRVATDLGTPSVDLCATNSVNPASVVCLYEEFACYYSYITLTDQSEIHSGWYTQNCRSKTPNGASNNSPSGKPNQNEKKQQMEERTSCRTSPTNQA